MTRHYIRICLFALVAVGCSSPYEYPFCDLDPASPNAAVAACGAESTTISCVVTEQIQCESRICARYRGSEPFCTSACTSDSDCESGVCREFVLGTGEKHCVDDSAADR